MDRPDRSPEGRAPSDGDGDSEPGSMDEERTASTRDPSSDSSRPASASSGGDPPPPEAGDVPLGQRLFERPFLLLVLGILIMAVFYTGWGLFEIYSLTPAPLP